MTSSQELLDQFQPNLVGNMLGGWGFRCVQIKGMAPFGSNKGQNKENFDKNLKFFLLMNHWPECIETSLGQGDSSLFK